MGMYTHITQSLSCARALAAPELLLPAPTSSASDSMADFSAPIGSMSQGAKSFGASDLSTLDEPVSVTIMRDVTMVGNKMMCVLNPRKANIQTLKDWDLWGPLLLCLMLAALL